MAIDTAAKRFSIMDADLPTQPGMVPPSGTINVGPRLALLWLYSGIVPTVDGAIAATIGAVTSAIAATFGPNGIIAATVGAVTSAITGTQTGGDIWTAVTPQTGSWSSVSPQTGTWTTVTPQTGTWTDA